ncbi:cation:proton antiporter [Photobacterium phosphoreum]|uniref:cation:proton antiporter n=1 Tax=Photobacterium phosphoreum TaxID=659 RepID=UPI0007F86AB5|nr:cation:proton antiporter [Photobacterium phosphoreum]OBU33563.1 sodium:proton antiporter [Photobacterium phosphoreum]PSW36298.1 cation:proton antiporter [Photobacterium phosphoreum]
MLEHLTSIITELCSIIIVTAIFSSLFLYTRQPIILAYIFTGIVIGPYGLQLVTNATSISQMGHLGVILLLFILGLNLQPQRLLHLFKQSAVITLVSCLLFFISGFLFALLINLTVSDALITAAAMMFSSTVISLKLIPTTTLHHLRMGEVMTSILLMQDIIAISVLLLLNIDTHHSLTISLSVLIIKLIAIIVSAYFAVKYIMLPLLKRFDVIQEYSFIATLAWCFFWAVLSHSVGLSYETGAFIAGISLAVSPVSQAIAVHLKPLREFFLILFFFAIGAKINLWNSDIYTVLGIIFGICLIRIKAWGFKIALILANENHIESVELRARLSQASEFSLLLIYAATAQGLLSDQGKTFIETVTITTFVISTYWIVRRYPTPISMVNNLRKD